MLQFKPILTSRRHDTIPFPSHTRQFSNIENSNSISDSFCLRFSNVALFIPVANNISRLEAYDSIAMVTPYLESCFEIFKRCKKLYDRLSAPHEVDEMSLMLTSSS